MFRNRALEVKMVKNTKKADSDDIETLDIHAERSVAIVANTFDRAMRKIGIIVCTYVVLDTLRQVMVASASKR